MRPLAQLIAILVIKLICSFQLISQTFPNKQWDRFSNPEEAGFSSAKLAEAQKFAHGINTVALTLVVDGKIVYEWGEVKKKFMTHSIRKSFLSAMYGRYVEEGTIDLNQPMANLGINDVLSLSDEELKATIRDCLKSRSGVYHPALYESPGMKALKPERFSERAGAHWYYNNWDFNVAGTLFMQLTGKDFFEALENEIAKPIQMEDFEAKDGWYVEGEESVHKAYPFRITSHDLARFGWLMLNKGNWRGRQVVSAEWVEESTRYHSDATLYSSDGYGYMWWVSRNHNKFTHLPNVELPEGTYSARGAGGHFLLIIPAHNMVIVHRADTDVPNKRVRTSDFGTLVGLILAAKENEECPRSSPGRS